MRRSILLLLLCGLTACGASQHAWTRKDITPQQAFDSALSWNDGKKAAYDVLAGHLDREKARRAVLARMTALVQGEDIPSALSLAEGYGFDKTARDRFARTLFDDLVHDGMCVRAAELGKTFGLGTKYGQAAVECLRQGSPVEAAAVSCEADVGDAYRDKVVREAWASMETLTGDDRFTALGVMLDASCGPLEAPAKTWFMRTLTDASRLHYGRMILERAQALKWGWDLKAMYRELLKAAIAFDSEGEAQYVIGDEAFAAEDADYDLYLAYQVAHLRCEEAVALVAKRGLGLPKAETIVSDAKCFGAIYGSLDWNIQEKDAPAWFDLALRHGKIRLARKLADKLKDPKPAIEKVEKAAFDGGDFDAAMDFPARDGEDARQHQDRVLQAALDRGDEWFVVRWNIYGQNQVDTSRRDGWIERAYLHALLRKDPKMAADCIAKHSVAATAEAGERVAFEEALRARDADTAIDLARVYELGDDCGRRAALLKARQIQAAERAKADAAAAKRRKRRKDSGDWNP